MFATVKLRRECQLIGLRVLEHLGPVELKLDREANYEDLIRYWANGIRTAIGNDQIESGGERVLLIRESLDLNLDGIEARGCRHPAKLLGGSREGKGKRKGVACCLGSLRPSESIIIQASWCKVEGITHPRVPKLGIFGSLLV